MFSSHPSHTMEPEKADNIVVSNVWSHVAEWQRGRRPDLPTEERLKRTSMKPFLSIPSARSFARSSFQRKAHFIGSNWGEWRKSLWTRVFYKWISCRYKNNVAPQNSMELSQLWRHTVLEEFLVSPLCCQRWIWIYFSNTFCSPRRPASNQTCFYPTGRNYYKCICS